MSCCTVTKNPTKSLVGLKKHFDDVELERTNDYNLLTLRDRAAKNDIDWIVWLQVKIPFKDHNSHAGQSDEQYVEGVSKGILDWVDLLKNFDRKNQEVKQLSLFDDPTENNQEELEPEPEMPLDSSDRAWSKYWKAQERVRKNNLMKQYTFFELFDPFRWYAYYEDYVVQSWIRQLPQNNKEMIELVKEAIIEAEEKKEWNHWQNKYHYISDREPLSDIELMERVKHCISLQLVPYKNRETVYYDDSYNTHFTIDHNSISYRFTFYGRKVEGNSWLKSDNLPTYELNDTDFILWLRQYFNIPYKEVISDDDILRENIKCLFKMAYGYQNPKFDAFKEIAKANTFQEFRAKAMAQIGNPQCGGSGYSIDGFHAYLNLFKYKKDIVLEISQSVKERLNLNRPIEGMEKGFFREETVYVYKLNMAQVLEIAYKLFKPKEKTLFDF